MTENNQSFVAEAEPRRQEDEERNDDSNKEKRVSTEVEVGGGREMCESKGLQNSKTEESREPQLETLEERAVPAPEIRLENDHSGGSQVNSALEMCADAELKQQHETPQQEVKSKITQGDEAQTQNQLHSFVCPSSSSEISPTFVVQTVNPTPSPSLLDQERSPPTLRNATTEDAGQQSPSVSKSHAIVPVVKSSIPDGYNWRKYGQKQVKSPEGSRSYYKCTFSQCYAKKIECSDHCGRVIEIVNKGTHSHDPPRKNNTTRESKMVSSPRPVLGNAAAGDANKFRKEPDPEALSKQQAEKMATITDRKGQNSSGSDESSKNHIKDGHIVEPEPKRRLKKSNLECSETVVKPGKKQKLVVHAMGDVGISGDGYRWRKYGQKMVKGNPHPRNYYRCTSAGCPVRKHIETAVDNSNAVVITYKGVHDHDMPVPKKRHGPPSAPLIAAAAPSMNVPIKKADAVEKQASSMQWSVSKEGELTGEILDKGGDKQKTIDSARTLLSIGFEIKPC